MSTTTDQLKQQIQREAAQCVKCGLCLPHCPTYIQTKNECESPRGRIALMDGFSRGQIALSKKAQLYLDHCLTCRACETVCPAEVQYGKLIDHGRALQSKKTHASKMRGYAFILQHPRFFFYLLRCYQKLGLQKLARKIGLLKLFRLTRADSFLPPLKKPFHLSEIYSACSQERGRVALFTGCIHPEFEPEIFRAAITVLTHCGYSVYIPRNQRCCGALFQHTGHPDRAAQFIETNLQAFQQNKISTIITLASGCSAMLCEYPVSQKNKDFPHKIKDISHFLTTISWPDTLRFNPLPQRIALHIPCTLRNVLQQSAASAQLLQKIPAIELITLTTTQCCGAAGLYMLQHPQMADTLLENTFKELEQIKPDCIATSNIGCSLHLARRLREKNSALRVVHPITLIAQQLQTI